MRIGRLHRRPVSQRQKKNRMGSKPIVRSAEDLDAGQIADIYNHYVEHSIATFEEKPVELSEMAARLRDVHDAGFPWLVAQQSAGIVGYAYASQWKSRSAYRYSVEVTVYLDPQATGVGWGTRLYNSLFADLKDRGFRTAIGGISLPNPASVALHEKMGMTQVAQFRSVGYKLGQWIDVGYWQVDLGSSAIASDHVSDRITDRGDSL